MAWTQVALSDSGHSGHWLVMLVSWFMIGFDVSKGCSSRDYNSATSDTIVSSISIPEAPTTSSSLIESVDLSRFVHHRSGTGDYQDVGIAPEYNDSDGSIEFNTFFHGKSKWLFNEPIIGLDPLPKIYPQFDHSYSIWHKISFEVKSVEIIKNNVPLLMQPWIRFFEEDDFDDETYPRGAGETFGGSFDGIDYFKILKLDESLSTEGAESLSTEGEDNYNNGILFNKTECYEWTLFEFVFQFEDQLICKKCIMVLEMVLSKEDEKFQSSRNVTFQLKNMLFERISSPQVKWENPMNNFYSEIAEIPRMDPLSVVEAEGWQRDDCPHLWSNLYEWHDSSTWDNNRVPSTSDSIIYIPENKNVIIRSCSLNNDVNNWYQRIYIPSSSSLIFDDSDIDIHVEEIWVDGNLYVGSQTCRLYSSINFYFHGDAASSSTGGDFGAFESTTQSSKGIIVVGNIQIHGKQYHPTWTKLAISAYSGDNVIYLQESTNWEVGQEIAIMTSIYQDYPESHQNEVKTIVAIGDSSWAKNNVIYFGDDDDDRLNYFHYSGIEYQTEVSLLTRRIKFEGLDWNDTTSGYQNHFGGHTRVQFGTATGQFRGVMMYHMGQRNVLARYPFHFHQLGDAPNALVSDCSVYHSFFRCVAIHGTNNATLERNTVYGVDGHCFYIEDGVEEYNVIQYNSVAFVKPIGTAAAGTCFQGEHICSGCKEADKFLALEKGYNTYRAENKSTVSVPADVAPSAFYVSNMYNVIRGNIASGGWAGFSFINMKTPLGDYLGECDDPAKDAPIANCPYNRPTLEFDGNIAHSSGFYWGDQDNEAIAGCGSCFYVGGEMWYDESQEAYIYYTSRVEHNEYNADGSKAWAQFTNTKAYLCDFGVNYWGSRVNVKNFEAHDTEKSIFFLGETSLENALINGWSNNEIGANSLTGEREAFQFYDTSVKTLLKDVTFRNYKEGEMVMKYSTATDDGKTSEANVGLLGIHFENVDDQWRIVDRFCGEPCSTNLGLDSEIYFETQASRNMAIYDYDGSASGMNLPTIISPRRDFWRVNDDCVYDDVLNFNYCPWYGQRESRPWEFDWRYHNLVHIDLHIVGLTDESVQDEVSGYFSQWGRNYSTPYSLFPGVTGPSNIGWYYRAKHGAPKVFEIGSTIQIPRKSFIVLAIRYGAGFTFKATLLARWDNEFAVDIPMASSYDEIVNSDEDLYDEDEEDLFVCEGDKHELCTESGGLGPSYYYDGEYLYVRIVSAQWYSAGFYNNFNNLRWQYEDFTLWNVVGYAKWVFNVTECNGCTPIDVDGATFYDVEDIIPDKFPNHVWTSTGYYDDATNFPTSAPFDYDSLIFSPVSFPSESVDDDDDDDDDVSESAKNSNNTAEEDAGGLIAALVISILLFLACVAGASFVWYRRRQKASKPKSYTFNMNMADIGQSKRTSNINMGPSQVKSHTVLPNVTGSPTTGTPGENMHDMHTNGFGRPKSAFHADASVIQTTSSQMAEPTYDPTMTTQQGLPTPGYGAYGGTYGGTYGGNNGTNTPGMPPLPRAAVPPGLPPAPTLSVMQTSGGGNGSADEGPESSVEVTATMTEYPPQNSERQTSDPNNIFTPTGASGAPAQGFRKERFLTMSSQFDGTGGGVPDLYGGNGGTRSATSSPPPPPKNYTYTPQHSAAPSSTNPFSPSNGAASAASAASAAMPPPVPSAAVAAAAAGASEASDNNVITPPQGLPLPPPTFGRPNLPLPDDLTDAENDDNENENDNSGQAPELRGGISTLNVLPPVALDNSPHSDHDEPISSPPAAPPARKLSHQRPKPPPRS